MAAPDGEAPILDFGNEDYPFVAITLWSTMTGIGSTCYGTSI